ncbi:MAG TPA: transketolase C-terminal domain-containing protein [Gemmatimonadales bacterium]|nr:transketolase C-terminal domain-containing protein [Gemmatimonadales bacterium]
MSEALTYVGSLNQALRDLLARRPEVVVIGEDLADPYGGAFKVTRGLSTAFPGRVISTPISEEGIVGIAGGMALRGLRPIVELMFGDFLLLAADPLVNYIAKYRAMYGGKTSAPVIVRAPMGGGRGYGPTHSQSLEKMFLGVPHLRVVAPSVFHDPGALLTAEVAQTTEPTLFIEHKLLYPLVLRGSGATDGLHVEQRAHGPNLTSVVRNYEEVDRADIALVAYGGMSILLPEFLSRMAEEEIKAVALLPSHINRVPWDWLADEVAAVGRVVVAEEGTSGFGWTAAVAGELYARARQALKADIGIVCAEASVVPAAKSMESEMLPTAQKLIAAALRLLN